MNNIDKKIQIKIKELKTFVATNLNDVSNMKKGYSLLSDLNILLNIWEENELALMFSESSQKVKDIRKIIDSNTKNKFESWAYQVKLLGKPAFDLSSWDEEEQDYDDFATALAFLAWKDATQQFKTSCFEF